MLPPQLALNPVSGLFANPGPSPTQAPGVESRVSAGAVPTDIMGTAQQGSSYLGSMYNWAAMLAMSASPPIDGNLDGNPDFGGFVWPDPNTNPELYTTQALDTVAIPQGSLFPGSGLPASTDPQMPHPMIPGLNPTFARPSLTYEALCTFNTAFDQVIPGSFPIEVKADNFQIICPASGLPGQDIKLRDILDGSAENKIGRATAKITNFVVELAGVPDLPAVSIEGYFDFGNLVVRKPNYGLANMLQLADANDGNGTPITFTITCTSRSEKPSSVVTGGILMLLCGEHIIDDNPPWPITQTYNQFGFRNNKAPIVSILTTLYPFLDYNTGCFWPLPLLIRDNAQFKCDNAFQGQLRVVQAIGEGIRDDVYNPAWNFYNWLRGDPGFQPGDVDSPTRPGLAQRLNLVLYTIDRAAADCPATLAEVPTRRAPPLTTPCSDILPDDSSTLVGVVEELIENDVGDSNQRRFVGGIPADLSTALAVLADFMVTVPGRVGTLNASGAHSTLLGSAQATFDIFDNLIGRFNSSIATSTIMEESLTTNDKVADLGTAASEAGIKLAADFKPYFGPARVSAQSGSAVSASTTTTFVFNIEGTR